METERNEPERGPADVLVLVDVINDLEFPGGEDLLESALPAAERIAELATRCRATGLPVIYANDNFGDWRSDFSTLVRHCLEDGVRGEPLVEQLQPRDDDYYVLKPRHSAFFETPLHHLLDRLGARTLALAGFATEQCVLLTAADAYMRGYGLYVPRDASASETDEAHRQALAWMARVADADLREAEGIPLAGG